jgi:membrane protease YdiL (CAAX protease family)
VTLEQRIVEFLKWLVDYRAAHEECLAEGAPPPSKKKSAPPPKPRLDYKVFVVLLTVGVSLTMQEYWGDREVFAKLTARGVFGKIPGPWWELLSFVWWTGWRVLGYVILPFIAIAAMPGERIRDYGWTFKDFSKHIWLYLALFLMVAPLIWMMSHTKDFRAIYPFYRQAHRSTFDLVAWEILYAIQFLSLEFFFRGFMLRGLRRAIGVYAIPVMVVPYCMIHYGKALPETFGSIIAGLILGTIALRTRSIWGAVMIHVGVALMMDLLCVRQF